MGKSIETIWQEGFRAEESLSSPKIKDFYNQKSMHLIDRFKRVLRINLYAIPAVIIILLSISYAVGIPVTGLGLAIVLSVILAVNARLNIGLSKIDKNQNSYVYIKSFYAWVRKTISINELMARFYYPFIFLSILLGFWFKKSENGLLGEELIESLGNNTSELITILGIPIVVVIPAIFIMFLLFIFGARIYRWDVNLIYSRLLSKLSKLVKDMEALKT